MPYMRDATRASLRLSGRALAEDVEALSHSKASEVRMWVLQAQQLLHTLDQMDIIGGDEAYDAELMQIAHGDGEQWLKMAEEGRLEFTSTGALAVAHVLDHFNAGGAPAPPWVTDLLNAIAKTDEQHRDALAAGIPELVGLWRAVTEVPGGLARLVAVMDQR